MTHKNEVDLFVLDKVFDVRCEYDCKCPLLYHGLPSNKSNLGAFPLTLPPSWIFSFCFCFLFCFGLYIYILDLYLKSAKLPFTHTYSFLLFSISSIIKGGNKFNFDANLFL
jgi:hypothetical protein